MIQQITIQNFKSIGSATVDLTPVTVLIGRSGAGKSNFLRAIRFLRNFLLHGDQAIESEGGWNRIFPFGNPCPVSISVRFSIPGYAESFRYHLQWAGIPHNPSQLHLAAEGLLLGETKIFERAGQTWNSWPKEGRPPQAQPRLYLNSFPTASEAVLAFTALTSGIGWHDFPADVFRTHSPNQQSQRQLNGGLNDSASNYLEIILGITQDLRDQLARRKILARLKQINPTVTSVELDSITKPNHVIVGHRVGERLIGLDLSQESDGFRRYYAHLLALYQTPPRQVLMFEEPENGIYPGALLNLAEEFNLSGSAGRGQILLTTQSPDLLDGFAAEQIRVVDLDENQLTQIAPLDSGQAEALKEKLLEPGELLTVDEARAKV